MKYRDITAERTKRVIFLDKLVNPVMFNETLKIELYSTLSQFMEISVEDIKCKIVVESDGTYSLNFAVKTKRLKQVGAAI